MVVPLWALNTIKNLCSPKKWTKIHQNFFRGCYPLRSPIMPNFIKIGQTSLEKSVKNRYLFGPSQHFFCHGQKLTTWVTSRSVQEARLKIEDGGWLPFWKLLNAISQQPWPILIKFGTTMHFSHPNLTGDQMFKNLKIQDGKRRPS